MMLEMPAPGSRYELSETVYPRASASRYEPSETVYPHALSTRCEAAETVCASASKHKTHLQLKHGSQKWTPEFPIKV